MVYTKDFFSKTGSSGTLYQVMDLKGAGYSPTYAQDIFF